MTPPPGTSRRGLLGLAGLGTAGLLTGCGAGATRPRTGVTRHHYGRLTDQFGDLYLPGRTPHGTVVLLHGGFWLSDYGLDLMAPIAGALQRDGWAVWNLEYRRLDAGGGWPATFEDTAAGVDHLAGLDGVDRTHVVLLGHSAGGQLAAWAASRTARTPGGPPRVDLAGVVSLAGVLDLVGAAKAGLGNGAVQRLIGGSPQDVPGRYTLGDPTLLAPARVPVSALRGRADDVVPASQLRTYLAADRRAGGAAVGLTVPGDHFTIIDPGHPSWATTRGALLDLARG